MTQNHKLHSMQVQSDVPPETKTEAKKKKPCFMSKSKTG